MGTGISMEIPTGFYVELHARSGLHKYGWTLVNCVGIIDEDYRGEIIIALQPTVMKTIFISKAISLSIDEITTILAKELLEKCPLYVCQLALHRKESFNIEYVDQLSNTDRGNKGFGSSTQA
jgi:dUTP pyrophosphatase